MMCLLHRIFLDFFCVKMKCFGAPLALFLSNSAVDEGHVPSAPYGWAGEM